MEAYFAVDMETTGLTMIDRPLEIAVKILDRDSLRELQSHTTVFPFPKEEVGNSDFVVINMHMSNGLWEDCNRVYENGNLYKPMQAAYSEADDAMHTSIELCKSRGYTRFIPFGNTVSFDVSFMKEYFPKTAALLHYGVMDVSSIERFMDDAEIITGQKASNNNHRAEQDILDSIANYKKYLDIAIYLSEKGIDNGNTEATG